MKFSHLGLLLEIFVHIHVPLVIMKIASCSIKKKLVGSYINIVRFLKLNFIFYLACLILDKVLQLCFGLLTDQVVYLHTSDGFDTKSVLMCHLKVYAFQKATNDVSHGQNYD